MEYSAQTNTLTKAEYNKLVKPIYDLILPRYNICRNISLAIKYLLREAMGLGFKNLFITQGISKLTMFMEERSSNTLSNPLVNTNFKAALINIRIGGYYLFGLNYDKFQYLL